MQLSEKWLRQWVNPDIDTNTLVEQLTIAGLEVDSVEPAAPPFNNVKVGLVVECEQHPDADKLKVCTVDVGESEPKTIVCGGANVRKGLKVAAALIGAKLPDGLSIKKAKLRGVTSEGMICGASELHLAQSDSGIMELPDDAPVGMDLREYFDLDDACIDIDLTPNRGDCASVLGIAREVAALNSCPLVPFDLEPTAAQIDDSLNVNLIAATACPRYVGRVIRNIDATAKTPFWMVERLRRSGLRAIHPVVDISNYVMLELGQPLHAFDLNKINGTSITIRHAKPGETLILLDAKEVVLTENDLIIADDKNPLALAGIMGGLDSGVTLNTTDIFLEGAFFESIGIAKSARHHKVNSDSSYRFERGVDFNLQTKAIDRFSQLLLEIVGGQAGPITEVVSDGDLPIRENILLRADRIKHILGISIEVNQIEQILNDFNMSLSSHNQGWVVTAPSYRFDIAIEVDLIEEIARVYGYNNVPTANPVAELIPILDSEAVLSEDLAKRFFANQGYNETLTYSFVDEKIEKMMTGNSKPRKLLNPISSEMAVMRSSIWTGLIQALRYNQDRSQARIRLFEIGLCFQDHDNHLSQTNKLALLLTGSKYPEQWSVEPTPVDFYDLKGDVEQLFALNRQHKEFTFVPGEHVALHPGKCARLMRGEEVIGYLGELHPSIQQKLQLKQKVYLFEADFDALALSSVPVYTQLSKFPSVRRDLAVIVDKSILYDHLKDAIVENAGKLLQSVMLFDVYCGEGIDLDKKSVAMALEFQHPERTLVDEEVNKVFDKLVGILEDNFLAKLRM